MKLKTDMGVVLTEYFGEGDYAKRRSEIVKYGNKYRVNMFEDDVLKKQIDVVDKTLYHSEDTAENWVIGVIN